MLIFLTFIPRACYLREHHLCYSNHLNHIFLELFLIFGQNTQVDTAFIFDFKQIPELKNQIKTELFFYHNLYQSNKNLFV